MILFEWKEFFLPIWPSVNSHPLASSHILYSTSATSQAGRKLVYSMLPLWHVKPVSQDIENIEGNVSSLFHVRELISLWWRGEREEFHPAKPKSTKLCLTNSYFIAGIQCHDLHMIGLFFCANSGAKITVKISQMKKRNCGHWKDKHHSHRLP